MPKFKIIDPQSGKTVTIEAPKAPTQEDAEGIFQQAGLREPMNAQENKVLHYKNPVLDFLVRGYQQPGALGRVDAPNGLERSLLPRSSANQDMMMAGQDPSFDQRVGQVGESVNRSLYPLVATNPLLAGVLGVAEGATQPGASLQDRATGGVSQGVGQAVTAGALKILGKVARPFKSTGEFKTAELAKAEGKTISGDNLYKALEAGKDQVSPTMQASYSRFLETAKQYQGQNIPVSTAAEILKNANTAYTAAGKVGKAATARFNDILAKSLRSEIANVAPGVAKANQIFSNLYKTQDIAKGLAKPAATAVGVGLVLRMLGMGGERD